MLDKLDHILTNFKEIVEKAVKDGTVKTMFIDYEEPFVKRIWFPYEDCRVYLHQIEVPEHEVFFHPHKWDSAMIILDGKYEMGIGHSETNEEPKVDCKLILDRGTRYEMTEKDAWHYVKPIHTAYTLMVTGGLNGRQMPKESPKDFRPLTLQEIMVLFRVISDNIHRMNENFFKESNHERDLWALEMVREIALL